MKTYKSVDEYIKKADKDKQSVLCEVRALVAKTVPKAEEGISYGMPAFKFNGKPLFYFAAMKVHLGLYPTPGPVKTLASQLKDFSTSKGCVRVPWNTKIPQKLIAQLIKERLKEIKVEK